MLYKSTLSPGIGAQAGSQQFNLIIGAVSKNARVYLHEILQH
jgi:hypothetical protein